jgi:hypothetical protein
MKRGSDTISEKMHDAWRPQGNLIAISVRQGPTRRQA